MILIRHLLGQYNGVTTQFYLTDALGSVVSTFEDTAGSAAILGNQSYGPYGKKIYSAGSMGTNKGYTGQYQDATGLDYYNARYYDSVIGRFVSADSVQGNTKGMDPYDYVGGNPETATDPTGQRSVGCDPTESDCSSGGIPTGGGGNGGSGGCVADVCGSGDGGGNSGGDGSTTTTGLVGCQATWDCYPNGYQPQTPQTPTTNTGHANPKIVTAGQPASPPAKGADDLTGVSNAIHIAHKASDIFFKLAGDMGVMIGDLLTAMAILAAVTAITAVAEHFWLTAIAAYFTIQIGLMLHFVYQLQSELSTLSHDLDNQAGESDGYWHSSSTIRGDFTDFRKTASEATSDARTIRNTFLTIENESLRFDWLATFGQGLLIGAKVMLDKNNDITSLLNSTENKELSTMGLQ